MQGLSSRLSAYSLDADAEPSTDDETADEDDADETGPADQTERS